MSEELVKASATWMAQAIRRREVSAVELFDAHAARIAERDPRVNALVVPRLRRGARRGRRGRRRARARRAPRPAARRARSPPRRSIAVAGMPAPNGSRLFADHVSDADAVPMRRLRDAGAILLGKTNVPEFCSHWDTYNELFGATVNPHDPTRSAGGSSGGEAAALASAMTALGLGSDLGGSIRAPCHFCGLFGLKPGRDTVPLGRPPPDGQRPGPAHDGQRRADGALRRRPRAGPRGAGAAGARRRRAHGVAVFEEDGLQPVSAACRAAVRRAAAALGDAGHDVVEARPPGAGRGARRLRRGARHRGGGRAAARRRRARGRALGADPRDRGRPARLSSPRSAPTSRPSPRSCASRPRPTRGSSATAPRCARSRRTSRRRCGEASVPSTASPSARAASSRCARTPTRSGCRRSSVPVMRSEAGLPVGVQLIGRRGHERALLALARELERALGGWLDPDAS